MTCLYIIEDRVIGERSSTPYALSFIYICPVCGKNWASVINEGSAFLPERRPCRRHEWCDFVSGSLLSSLDSAWVGPMFQLITLQHVPKEVLRYELDVHLMYYEKGVLYDDSTN